MGALVARSEARVCGAATGREHVRAVRRQDPSRFFAALRMTE